MIIHEIMYCPSCDKDTDHYLHPYCSKHVGMYECVECAFIHYIGAKSIIQGEFGLDKRKD